IGSDVALFLALSKAVLELGLEDTKFISDYCANWDLMKAQLHTFSYQHLEQLTGISEADVKRVARTYGAAKNVVFAWGMGMTRRVHGVAIVESIATFALLRGMVGRPNAGLLPLRGHSNVQGIGPIGVKPVLAEDVMAEMERHVSISL